MPTDLIPSADVARAVGVSRGTVSRRCAQGKVPGAKLLHTARGPVWYVPARYADPATWRATFGKPGRKPGGETEMVQKWYVVSCGPHDWMAWGTTTDWPEFAEEMGGMGHSVSGCFDTEQEAEDHAKSMSGRGD